jgi:transposase
MSECLRLRHYGLPDIVERPIEEVTVMRSDYKVFIGLDVHKDSIAIAYADADFTQAPRFLGTTRYSVISVTKALAKLGKPAELSVCHEAGPCGYGLVRALREGGYATDVIAPSRVARQPGRSHQDRSAGCTTSCATASLWRADAHRRARPKGRSDSGFGTHA